MVQVNWTQGAWSDLDAIADYIALDKPEAAEKLVQRVYSHVELLGQHPELGPGIPELRPSRRYRQLVERPCRIFYRYDKDAKVVHILAVIRGEKLFEKRLLHRSD